MSDYKFKQDALVDVKPSHEFRFDTEGKEVLRLDQKGFHYKGKTVDDAGEAYSLFMDWLRESQEQE